MATSIKRSPYIAPRSARAYRLEMEGRTIFLMVGLVALTGVVIFALGVATGMGMREAEAPTPVAIGNPPPATQKQQPPAGESLAFNQGVKSPEPVIEGLKINQKEFSEQTQSLLKRAEKELKLEEIPPVREPVPARTGPGGSAVATPRPTPRVKVKTSPAAGALRYTVQVFSSRRRANARELMLKLKKQGFVAYLNQYQGPNRETWYRVRVGRLSRPEAERMAERLKKEANLRSPAIIQL